ncbi:DNA-binding transcriptional activator PspC [Candidatus Izimaplasma bacterium HR1]|jgi:phage shock protein PspC (stress-responsive transcriptional regulator)|uniref:PspC domain-containing protein n=1 Tax=Candidatus Izimoplasma sp. HR1 TaxID=1541959 RepID=UPI0004F66645|nr:DNA-binding transcriptional activator PspC [Candidatus Izimaplasma bacterium HR1]
MNESKKLYKTDNGSVLGGVCKGISEVYNIDVSMVRLITVLLLFAAGMPFIVYIIMWIVLPDKKDVITQTEKDDEYSINDDEYYY